MADVTPSASIALTDSSHRTAPVTCRVSSSGMRAAFVLGAAQLLFVVNFFWSLWRGPVAPANPWQVGTLEWSVPSPPPHDNFDELPVVHHGPHELGNPIVRARLGRDWLGQAEAAELTTPAPSPPVGTGEPAEIVARAADGGPSEGVA